MTSTRRMLDSWRSLFIAFGLLLCLGLSMNGASADAPIGKEPVGGTPAQPKEVAGDGCELAASTIASVNPASGRHSLNGMAAISPSYMWAVGEYVDGAGRYRTLIQRWDGSAWNIVPSPNQEGDNVLNGVTVVSASDAWAVGSWGPQGSRGVGHTLIMRWNGSEWRIVAAPDPNPILTNLRSVDAVSANDVWAVGSYKANPSSLPVQTLTLHWDGRTWSLIPSPNGLPPYIGATNQGSRLYSVSSAGPGAIWAVGVYNYYFEETYFRDGLILKWDGAAWNEVPHSQIGQYSSLRGVVAVSPTEAWAVGMMGSRAWTLRWNGSAWLSVPIPTSDSSNELLAVGVGPAGSVWAVGSRSNYSTNTVSPLMMRWDSNSWTVIPNGAPRPGGVLRGVAAFLPSSAWAVGEYWDESIYQALPLAQRWDGSFMHNVPVPEIRQGGNYLNSVSALSTNDAWAVGRTRNPNPVTGQERPLVEHWDGSRWNVSPIPSDNQSLNNSAATAFNGVSALSPTDVWAVGSFQSSYEQTLAMHWNGTRWSIVPSPNRVSQWDNRLRAVAAVTSNDVWAVGASVPTESYNENFSRPIIMRWDGQSWILDYLNSIYGREYSLNSVDAASVNDIWAVGTGDGRTLTMHWNGSVWSRVTSPSPDEGRNILRGVSAASANDVWAVGYYGPAGTGRALILRWNGSQWNVMQGFPNLGTSIFPIGVEAVAANDVWVVGNYLDQGIQRAFTAHWDGVSWTVLPAHANGTGASFLNGVAAVPDGEVWAVGDYDLGTARNTFIQRYGAAQFSDVPTNNTFYPHIQCLACKGAESGYPCGGPGEPCDGRSNPYYRPNALITRDNIARMVAASAGFSEPAGGQIFQDVPPTNPYYEWIQRMANRQLIGGYPCGTVAGEPCVGPQNRPYYRPVANATRGQIAKIVSNGAGFSEPPSGQLFEDVPRSNPFYLWVQRLATRGVMGGYPCGGAGEPCGSTLRPYFRWGANATRGQTSKITANTFFPSCEP